MRIPHFFIKILPVTWTGHRPHHQTPLSAPDPALDFQHRHAYVAHPRLPNSFAAPANTQRPPQILFNDILIPSPPSFTDPRSEDYTAAGFNPARLRTRKQRIARPRSNSAYQVARKARKNDIEWDEDEVVMPNVEHRETLLEMAKITGDAYALPGSKSWYDLDARWNSSYPFGWEDDADGLRGNIFVSTDNTTVILSIKGTSLFMQGPTMKRDKLNDNILFSCCCAHVDYAWRYNTVCDCCTSSWECAQTCLENALEDDDLFYHVGINLYNNLTYLYPDSQVWLVGHSLGGGVASLLGATFGAPTVTFEAPGERLAAHRLHLPFPPPPPTTILENVSNVNHPLVVENQARALHPVTHIYHTADPIPFGACTGVRSLCAKGGYALETGCHLGKTIVYDTVNKNKWRVSINNHRISRVVELLEGEWEEEGVDGESREVPEPNGQEDCVDCFKWKWQDDL